MSRYITALFIAFYSFSSFSQMASLIDHLDYSIPIDSIGFQYKTDWPECYEIDDLKITYNLQNAITVSWGKIDDLSVEFEIELANSKESNSKTVSKFTTAENSFVIQGTQLINKDLISIRSRCYDDINQLSYVGPWSTAQFSYSNNSSADCNALNFSLDDPDDTPDGDFDLFYDLGALQPIDFKMQCVNEAVFSNWIYMINTHGTIRIPCCGDNSQSWLISYTYLNSYGILQTCEYEVMAPCPTSPPPPDLTPPTCNNLIIYDFDIYGNANNGDCLLDWTALRLDNDTDHAGVDAPTIMSYNIGSQIVEEYLYPSSNGSLGGSISAESGTNVSLSIPIRYLDKDGFPRTLTCDTTVVLDCGPVDTIPPPIIDQICSQILFGQNGCVINWNTPSNLNSSFTVLNTNTQDVIGGLKSNDLFYMESNVVYRVLYTVIYVDPISGPVSVSCEKEFSCVNGDPDTNNILLCQKLEVELESNQTNCSLNWSIENISEFNIAFISPYNFNSSNEMGSFQSSQEGPILFQYEIQDTLNGIIESTLCLDSLYCQIDTSINPVDSTLICSMVDFYFAENEEGSCTLIWDSNDIESLSLSISENGITYNEQGLTGEISVEDLNVSIDYTIQIVDNGDTLIQQCNIDLLCGEYLPPENDPLCDNLNFDLVENGNGTCALSWESTDIVDSLELVIISGGLTYNSKDLEGSLILFSGGTVEIDYHLFISDPDQPLYVACYQEFECEDDSNNLPSCDNIIFNMEENENGVCELSWFTSEVDSVKLEFLDDVGNMIDVFHDLNGFYILPNDTEITVNVSMIFFNKGETTLVKCQEEFECDIIQIDPMGFCEIFSLIEAEVLDSNNIILNFAQGESIKIDSVFNSLNITIADFQTYVKGLKEINFTLSSTNEEYPNGDSLVFNLLDFSNDINVYRWSYLLENLSFVNLQASYVVSYLDKDGILQVCNSNDLSLINPLEETELEPEEDPNLPNLNCGDDPDTLIQTSVLFVGDIVGEVVYLNGFPLLVDYATGSNPYNGTGIAAVPFGSKYVSVDFNNLLLNENLKALEGELLVASDSPGNYPDFEMNAPPLVIGGDICIPDSNDTESGNGSQNGVGGLDAWGFDNEGIHNITGTTWDKDGFKQDGTYKETGSLYNPDGCSREGFTIDNVPCDPTGGTAIIDSFINQNKDTILIEAENILKELMGDYQNQLNEGACDSIRTVMDYLIQDLSYTPSFIKGENEEYFIPGLSDQFTEEPEILLTNINGRNEQTKELENSHVDLYQCDIEEEELKTKIADIQAICNGPQPSALVDHVLDEIASWGAWEKEQYIIDLDAFFIWLEKTVEDFLTAQSEEDYGVINQLDFFRIIPDINSIFNFDVSNEVKYASINKDFYFRGNALEQIDFDFAQGNSKINGVHRAFYLEKLVELNSGFGGSAEILPLKIEKSIGSYIFKIYLDSIVISTKDARLNAYLIIEDTESNHKIVFEGHNISFGAGGVGEESILNLATDVELRLNNAAKLILKGTPETYVAWDCDGFKHMGIDASIEFCSEFIRPLKPDLTPMPDSVRYRLDVAVAHMSSWLDFELQVDADPFMIPKIPSISWELSSMVIDMSSTSTPQIVLPESYDSPELVNGVLSNAWKGFHIQNLQIHMPNSFSNNASQLKIGASDIIIDGQGVTGQASVEEQLLTIEEGDIGGWPMSVNKFGIEVVQNQLTGASFRGKINVPIFKENMDYDAYIYPGDKYAFAIEPFANATVDMALATATLHDNCSISVEYLDSQFITTASLNGSLKINGNSESGNYNVDIPEIGFNGVVLSNKAPYFDAGVWELSNDVNATFKGFDLNLKNAGMYSPQGDPEKAGLMIEINLALNDASDGFGITAGGAFGILGKLETTNGRQKWIYDKIDPRGFCLEGNSFPGVEEISACIEWFEDDPIYGEGFRGGGNVKFKSFNAGLSAVAQFGKTSGENGYKYFFVDAMAELDTGIPCGPFSLSGFGGGISNHMQSTFDPDDLDFSNISFNSIPSGIGQSMSGKTYLPSFSTCLGFSGAAMFSMAGRKELFNGKVEIRFEFECGGGIQNIGFTGLGQFMKPPNTNMKVLGDVNTIDAALAGYIDMDYNFEEPSFHGKIAAHLNSPYLEGIGNKGKMVDAEMHFSPKEWYVYIGKPEQPCGVKFNYLNLGVNAYLDVGTNIPHFPAPPATVSAISGDLDRNESLRQSGAGFMFGAGINIDVDADAAIAKATLNAACGFDVMIKKYDGFECLETGEAIGLNGWYAMGQLWAYIEGKLKILGVNILEMGLAAILQARLPNPTIFMGSLGVKIKTLLFTAHKTINFKFGEDCTLVNSGGEDDFGLDIITQIDPMERSTDVAIDAVPEITFAIPLNRDYKMYDLNGIEQAYKVSLNPINGISLRSSTKGDLVFNKRFNSDKTILELELFQMLPGNDTITLDVLIDVFKNGEKVGEQTKSSQFVTMESYAYIPISNIKSAYPADGMYNYYKDEYNHGEGFIYLNQGQPSLFYDVPDHLRPKVVITSDDGITTELDYEYDPYSRKLKFHIADVTLESETFYKLELVQIGPTFSEAPENSEVNNPNEELIIYRSYFRTSAYNTFNEKMDDIEGETVFVVAGNIPKRDLSGLERFDKMEIGSGNANLVSLRTDVTNNWSKDLSSPGKLLDLFPYTDLRLEDDVDIRFCGGSIGVTPRDGNVSYDFLSKSTKLGYSGRTNTSSNLFESPKEPDLNGTSDISLKLYTAASTMNKISKSQRDNCLVLVTNEQCHGEGAVNFHESIPGQSNNTTIDEFVQDCVNNIIDIDIQEYDREIPDIYPGSYKVFVEYRLPDGTLSSQYILYFTK